MKDTLVFRFTFGGFLQMVQCVVGMSRTRKAPEMFFDAPLSQTPSMPQCFYEQNRPHKGNSSIN
jgi:hypothetical protein